MTRNVTKPTLNNWFQEEENMLIDEKIQKIACGTNHSLFLSDLGNLYACGTNNN
jgi:alpha-tubulin suppressor-like RCC1 family protein